MTTVTHSIGTVVRARDREWVVVPGPQDDDMLSLRPLGGTDDDTIGIIPGLEKVASATFPLPDPADFGDEVSAGILRDAIRLSVRAGAGPFRSFGRIAVEPRSYQLVPLMMALKLDPVRLLIADDVGIGKTIEAGLIARELFDRGRIRRLCVICPAHLCEQWQDELKAKFDFDAVLVRPGTVHTLQGAGSPDESIFEKFPITVVSIDYIKNERRRDEFLRACPELVIVDEAHTSAAASRMSGSQQQRHQLLKDLAHGSDRARKRHIVLTTATPHSGVEESFRSLLGLLDPAFLDLPDGDDIDPTDPLQQRLARHIIQRRRGDIRRYLDQQTGFPERESSEETWRMSPATSQWFDAVLAYARELVRDSENLQSNQQRVSWWAALAMLRAAISSPEAALKAFRNRASGLELAVGAESDIETTAIDDLGRTIVLDADTIETEANADKVPGADVTSLGVHEGKARRLRDLIKGAEALRGSNDPKLQHLIGIVRHLLHDGYQPIVFCRYIDTAEYVSQYLAQAFPQVTVQAVTGNLAPEARKDVIADLGAQERRILVATDCLSEGINLQDAFDAVVHYDLAWNPTRHEQREGRVDRFGQPRPVVRTLMLYGQDNPVDGAVMTVLLRKAESIRKRLGVIVAVPQDTGHIMESVFNAIFRGIGQSTQLALDFDAIAAKEELERTEAATSAEWDRIEQETIRWTTRNLERSNTAFAQHRINPDDVQKELLSIRSSLGTADDVERFVRAVAGRIQLRLEPRKDDTSTLYFGDSPDRVRSAFGDLGGKASVPVDFAFPVPAGVYHLSRTSPVVSALTELAITGALEPNWPLRHRPARRCSVIRTSSVRMETTLAVIRVRMRLREAEHEMLAEESLLVAWTWDDQLNPIALPDDRIEPLLELRATANISDHDRISTIQDAIDEQNQWMPLVVNRAERRAEAVRDAHLRVQPDTQDPIHLTTTEVMLPVDILGLFIYQPDAGQRGNA